MMEKYSKAYLPFFFIILIFILFYSMARDGADFERYTEWSRSINEGNIYSLSGNVESPVGVPLTQWSFGPGVIFLLGNLFFNDINEGALFIGWIFTIILWGSLFGIFYQAARRDIFLTVFGLFITFIGTHLGFYSTVYSSESLSYCCFTVMVFWVIKTKKWGIFDSLLIGILSGLLLIIRSQLVIYCIPLNAVMIFSIFKNLEQTSKVRKIIYLFLTSSPVVISILEVGLNNRWMTGSLIASPYVFGTEAFKSVDWTHPEFLAVLFHPWHGLLSYHPLFALGFIALIILIYKKKKSQEKGLFISLLCTFLVHVYLHASWYVWWLGTWTFGMRGLGVGAVILIPCLIHLLALRKHQNLSNRLWFILIFVFCFWSFLLMIQNNQTYTQFFTYTELLKAQFSQLISLFSFKFMLSLVVVVLVAFLTLAKPKREFKIIPYMILLFLSFMTVFSLLGHYTLNSGTNNWDNHYFTWLGEYILKHQTMLFKNSSLVFIIILVLLILVPISLNKILSIRKNHIRGKYISLVFLIFFIGVFVATVPLFARFAVNTEKMIKSDQKPPRVFRYRGTVVIEEIEASYKEYLRVPGFSKKKEAISNYLRKLKRTSKIPR